GPLRQPARAGAWGGDGVGAQASCSGACSFLCVLGSVFPLAHGVSSPIMPGKLAPARPPAPHPPPGPAPLPPAPPAGIPPVPKQLWTVDASLTPGSPVSDIGELSAAAADAVRAGGGTVLDSSHGVFPHGAGTLVLRRAE